MKLMSLRRIIQKYKSEKGNLVFPDGIYGGLAYSIDEEGFYGPLKIQDYIVPVYFTKESKEQLVCRLNNAEMFLENSETYDLTKYLDGIDLTYGDGWELEPDEFINMLKAGCVPDIPYLVTDDSKYEDYEDFVEEAIQAESHYTKWNELSDEDVIKWLDLFQDLLN